jgi:hypothetical protein
MHATTRTVLDTADVTSCRYRMPFRVHLSNCTSRSWINARTSLQGLHLDQFRLPYLVQTYDAVQSLPKSSVLETFSSLPQNLCRRGSTPYGHLLSNLITSNRLHALQRQHMVGYPLFTSLTAQGDMQFNRLEILLIESASIR